MADDDLAVGGRGPSGAALRDAVALPRRSDAEEARRLLDGSAWRDFCRALEAAGEHLAAFPAGESAAPGELQAEGVRYLLGLVRSGLLQALELADPAQPRFVRNPDSQARWGAENVDNQYLWARVSPDATYRIEGLRRSAFEFLVEVKDGYMQLGEDRIFATLLASELEAGPDGRFEILLSASRPEGHRGNWLPLPEDARYVAVRQYLVDWEEEEPARFEIFRLDGEGEPPQALRPEQMARRLDQAGRWTLQTARFWSEWVEELRAGHVPDRIREARPFKGGASAIVYGNDWWKLAPDEAMILETRIPQARYWQVQLCDVWFRSLDPAHRQTALNQAQARIDQDGRLRCVLAHRDPGVPNWLDTAGHREGMIQYRWIWAETTPQPTARTVPFARLREHLPPDTPAISPDDRLRAVALRRRHMARREPAS